MANNVTITRRVKIFVAEQDAQLKKEFIHTIYDWRMHLRNASNELLSYLYAKDQLQHYKFIDEATKRNYNIVAKPKKNATQEEIDSYNESRETEYAIRKDVEFGIIGAKGEPIKNNSDAYVLLSERLKGKMPMRMACCMQQAVAKTYKETRAELLSGKRSLATYKNNIQMPFDGKLLNDMQWNEEDKRFYFTLYGIPFGVSLGRDRSNNKVIIERCLSGEYKFCGSSIMIDDNAKCFYLYMTIQLPQEENNLDKDKVCYAILSVANPIVAQIDDSKWTYEIGTMEEFMYRRRQIQEALKRAQINAKYSVGGKGRKRKCQAIERFTNKEENYVRTKMHEYSRRLVDYAVKNGCGVIRLCNNDEQSEKDKSDELLLRNWSYHGLREMIAYKCKKAGIELSYDK